MIAKDITGGGKIDYVLMSLYLSLVGIGWLMIYAVGYKQGYPSDLSEFMLKSPVGKQTIAIGVSFLLVLLIFTIDEKFWRVFAYPLYGGGLVLLVLVLIFGKEINGAKAWFNVGGFGFQPVEVAKLGTSLALSSYMSTPSFSVRDSRSLLTILGILVAPMFLVMLQPDAGSMLVFLSFSIMLFREGMSPTPYIVGLSLAAIFILALVMDSNELSMYLMMLASVVFVFNITDLQRVWQMALLLLMTAAIFLFYQGFMEWSLALMALVTTVFVVVHSRRGRFRLVVFTTVSLLTAIGLVYTTSFAFNNVLKKHQRERINVWLRPDQSDPRGEAYNLINSKLAIGSGGLQGKGFLEGTMTKLSFVPEQHTDFIFCTIGEEQGFLGVFAVITIFVLFLTRIVQIAERQRANFNRLYAYCLAGIFFIHFVINIGMTMGLLPVIGIPLPFISSGGSSLLGFTMMLAVLMKLDSQRNYV